VAATICIHTYLPSFLQITGLSFPGVHSLLPLFFSGLAHLIPVEFLMHLQAKLAIFDVVTES
jgi:hypothetical protein